MQQYTTSFDTNLHLDLLNTFKDLVQVDNYQTGDKFLWFLPVWHSEVSISHLHQFEDESLTDSLSIIED